MVLQMLASGGSNAPVAPGVDRSDDPDDNVVLLVTQAPGIVGATAGVVKASTANYAHPDDEPVASRLAVKKNSVRTQTDVLKRAEAESRRKRVEELAKRSSAEISGDNDDAGNAARLKVQRASVNKLSTFPHLPTLPEGVTLRDDAMTKTNAFITWIPKLD